MARARRQHGMRGAAAFVLDETFGVGRNALYFGGDRLFARTDHDGGCRDAGFADRVQHVRKQRAPGDCMEHLGPRRTHARALAGREHDRKTRSSHHQTSAALLGAE